MIMIIGNSFFTDSYELVRVKGEEHIVVVEE